MENDTNLKLCSTCKLLLPREKFYLRNGKPRSCCKKCHEIEQKYRKRTPKYLAIAQRNNRNYYKTNRDLIAACKNKPCTDCGIQYEPFIMEFDHVVGEKQFNVSDKIRGYSFPKILAEINKCDVVCANCHRRRTYKKGYTNQYSNV